MKRLFSGLFFILLAADAVFAGEEGKPDSIRIDFSKAVKTGKAVTDWHYRGKPFTADAVFSIVKENGVNVLKVESKRSTGTILFDLSKIDLKKYPVLRWKWKASVLPSGGLATDPGKDDQALGIYVGAGKTSTNSVAFRYETDTPKGAEGSVKYGMGFVSVKWFSLRNRTDKLDVWHTEEVNIYDELNKIFKGRIPEKDLALSVSGNSQYTKSASLGYIEYFEFLPASAAKRKEDRQ